MISQTAFYFGAAVQAQLLPLRAAAGGIEMGRRQELREAFLEEDGIPCISEGQQLGRVQEVRGNSQIKCLLGGAGLEVMVFLPARFRNALWLRRGSIVIISQPEVNNYAIEQVLSGAQVKQLSKAGQLPPNLLLSWQTQEESSDESQVDLRDGEVESEEE